MTATPSIGADSVGPKRSRSAVLFSMLRRDPVALVAAIFLTLLVLTAIIGPIILSQYAVNFDLGKRNLPPFYLDKGWLFILGADSLGRSMLARLVVGAQLSLVIACTAVALSMTVGVTIGVFTGYVGGWQSTVIMRLTDIVISFPGLLLALVVLYVIGPSTINVILILALGRLPLFIRTARAQTLELRERMFVSAARSLGVSTPSIVFRHIVPLVLPTMVTVAAVDFASVILAESGLSFLGLGIQPPAFTWGAMVAAGRQYLQTGWWLTFFPGLMIMATTLCLNLLANWVRTATDPHQRWRLQASKDRGHG
ncbi:MAG: transporter permease [Devosia sp.]|uniref:ABC transporter permease n=1 Tax=Devosia sp. TaxID=1871048 RepID=UPI0026080128|nr:ABC transporter permease [Devosia sp.]MDB5539708.1 transporter permease [Devosia sp.]